MHAAHKAAAPTGDWLSTVYFQDSTHPSRFGQKLVAGVMAHRLTRQLVGVRVRVRVKVKVRVMVRVRVRVRGQGVHERGVCVAAGVSEDVQGQ